METKFNDGDGDCFMVAANMVADNQFIGKFKDPVLVHGMALGRGKIRGVRFSHAWVEDGDEVFDHSNGLRIDGLPRDAYYAIGKIEDTARYTVRETRRLLLKLQHYGPWEERFMADYQVHNDASDTNDPRNAPDCPEDRGFENETCQECGGFNACSANWPHPSDCKCLACEDDHEYHARADDAGPEECV